MREYREFTKEKRAKEEGREEGKEEGKRTEKIEIAKKMKKENADIEFIIKVTELSKEEIENL